MQFYQIESISNVKVADKSQTTKVSSSVKQPAGLFTKCSFILVFKLVALLAILGCVFAHVDEQVKFAKINPRAAKHFVKTLPIADAVKQLTPRVFESLINDASECLRDTLNNGDEDLGIPPVSPLEIDSITINFDESEILSQYIKGSLSIENLYLEGITSWEFTQLSDSINILPPGYTIRFTLLIPGISGSGSYDGTLTLLDEYEIYGAGDAAGSITNVQISGVATVGILGGINLSSLTVRVTVGDINFKITGLLNDDDLSELISDFISNELADFINDNQDVIGGYIEDIIYQLLDGEGTGEESELVNGLISKCIPL